MLKMALLGVNRETSWMKGFCPTWLSLGPGGAGSDWLAGDGWGTSSKVAQS